MFQKIKSTIDKGVTVVSVKSGTFIEMNKINALIENHQKEINELSENLGKSIYEQWAKEAIDYKMVGTRCAVMKEKYEEIAKLEEQKKQIENEKNQILGENAQIAGTPTECSCGFKNQTGDRFCGYCGKKLML